ncbi:hypothetical protein Csal_2564 [Chromohalobacter israelensis DSM 3043]|uniref:Uncharacterized protein n=1 Tax=Chromohalobacter israelensis (strain ATCC BAA-138 / DSM 3043 / CIP 106854 / NCIMB 13768 / 1H11) TaxID=290398 RepID=Q1QUE7_CHRI1|nr:hypothetical protein Csal_2564 [Chromohalobacter salexigens DSM 3043]
MSESAWRKAGRRPQGTSAMRFRIGKRRSTGLRLSALASVLAEGEGRWSGARQDEEKCGIGVPCDGAPEGFYFMVSYCFIKDFMRGALIPIDMP